MDELREIRLRWALRGCVLLLSALALAAIGIGTLPGHALYINGALIERTAAGSEGFAQFALCLLAPGALLWFRPRIGIAMVWSAISWVTVMGLLVFGGNHDSMGMVTLWPAKAMFGLIAPVLFTLLIGMPFGVAIYEAMARRSGARVISRTNPSLPAARVISRPRA